MIRGLVALILLALGLGQCRIDLPDDFPTPDHRRSPLPALHTEDDPVHGGRIVDARGRQVLLHGVNVNALVEYWQYGAFPTTFPLTEADAEMMAGTGLNAVRLLVSWSRVEPAPGRYDEHYLDEVARKVDLLERHGIYSIVDFHQDAWGSSLAARPDEQCAPGQSPAFGWDGAPAWATFDADAARCVPFGFRELSPAVRAAFGAFWQDATGPGGVGIRTRYVNMFERVAARFAHEPAVAGYDLMNEPNAFTAEEMAALADLSADAIDSIRAGEASAGGFSHLVLVEPSVLWSSVDVGPPAGLDHHENLVFAPHIYRGGLGAPGPAPRADFERARRDADALGGVPVLVGEWGSSPSRAASPDDHYFRDHQALQDEFQFSATLWTWRESCGDPHKAGEARAGAIPSVWGVFEVDCRTNAVLGTRDALIDDLTRARVRAAPGRLVQQVYLPETETFAAAGAAAPPKSTVVVWYPGEMWERRDVDSDGLRGVHARPAPHGGVLYTGRTTGGEWRLAVSPS